MASQEQIDANRRNAKKSCGPKSARGKQLVRLNPVKHGLRAEHVVLSGENPEEFHDLYHSLYEDWRPAGARENHLFEEIVDGRWVLQRVRTIRTGRMNKECYLIEQARAEEQIEVPPSGKLTIKAMAVFREEFQKYLKREELRKTRENIYNVLDKSQEELEAEYPTDGPKDYSTVLAVAYRRSIKDLEMISRYETAALRRVRNAERELERLQAARKSSVAKAPSIIDVTDQSAGEN